jgi:hypothetical protein
MSCASCFDLAADLVGFAGGTIDALRNGPGVAGPWIDA